jgi:hypothetical protein
MPQTRRAIIYSKEETLKESFRFYITHIVADLRDNGVILVERRRFVDKKQIEHLAMMLRAWGWEEEKIS